VTVTTTTTTTATAAAPPASTTTTTAATTTTAPPASTTTTAPAPTTGSVDVAYEAIRPNATITVAVENEAGAAVASQDASATGTAAFPAVAPGRYRVAISETGRPEQSGDTATSSAVVTRTEFFDLGAGGTVSVSCVGNGDCTIVA